MTNLIHRSGRQTENNRAWWSEVHLLHLLYQHARKLLPKRLQRSSLFTFHSHTSILPPKKPTNTQLSLCTELNKETLGSSVLTPNRIKDVCQYLSLIWPSLARSSLVIADLVTVGVKGCLCLSAQWWTGNQFTFQPLSDETYSSFPQGKQFKKKIKRGGLNGLVGPNGPSARWLWWSSAREWRTRPWTHLCGGRKHMLKFRSRLLLRKKKFFFNPNKQNNTFKGTTTCNVWRHTRCCSTLCPSLCCPPLDWCTRCARKCLDWQQAWRQARGPLSPPLPSNTQVTLATSGRANSFSKEELEHIAVVFKLYI